jgi:hypothetical protein
MKEATMFVRGSFDWQSMEWVLRRIPRRADDSFLQEFANLGIVGNHGAVQDGKCHQDEEGTADQAATDTGRSWLSALFVCVQALFLLPIRFAGSFFAPSSAVVLGAQEGQNLAQGSREWEENAQVIECGAKRIRDAD